MLGFKKIRKGYSGARPDVIRLLPDSVDSVLDVGCGAGTSALLLLEKMPNIKYLGVEPDITLLPKAPIKGAKFLNESIETALKNPALLSQGPFEVILLADVLEHLVSPELVLLALPSLMTINGVVISSLPNIRHYSTFWRLLTTGRWPKLERGIHDKTHLHFYCRKDILDLFAAHGFALDLEKRNLRLVERTVLSQPPAQLFDFWPFREFITFQYIHRWTLKTK